MAPSAHSRTGSFSWRSRALWLLLATIALEVAAALLPWWVVSTPDGLFASSSYYLTYRFTAPGGDAIPYYYTIFYRWPLLHIVFGWTTALVEAGLALSVSALGVFLLSRRRPRWERLGRPLGFAGAAAMLAAPVYLFFSLPQAAVTLYIGSSAAGPATAVPASSFFGGFQNATWGAGPGWYLALASSFALAYSASIGFPRTGRHERDPRA